MGYFMRYILSLQQRVWPWKPAILRGKYHLSATPIRQRLCRTWGTCLHTFFIKEINHRFLRRGTFLHLFLKDNAHISGYDFGSWVVVIYNECSNVFKRGIQSQLPWASWIVLQKGCESWTSSSIWWPPTRTIGRYKTRYRNHCLPSWCQGLFCPWVFHFFKSNHEVRRYLRKFRRQWTSHRLPWQSGFVWK